LLSPILHRLLDAALDSFTSIDLGEGEAGPPRPMPNGSTLEQSRTSLHSMLDDFSLEAPFTIQRLCELILEPRKQYGRIDKFIVAVERLLVVTSTIGITPPEALPPVPRLSSLGEVNENRPSPYDGEPPAGPQPSIEDRLQPMGNGIMDSDEYAIFVGAETGQHGTGELVTIDGHSHGHSHGSGVVAVGSPLRVERIPTPMDPSEVIHAEAFVQAALGTTSSSPSAAAGVLVGKEEEKEPVAAAVAAAVAAVVVKPVMEAAAASAVETQQPRIQEQQQQQQVKEEAGVEQPMEPAREQAVADEKQHNQQATPLLETGAGQQEQKDEPIEPSSSQEPPPHSIKESIPRAAADSPVQ